MHAAARNDYLTRVLPFQNGCHDALQDVFDGPLDEGAGHPANAVRDEKEWRPGVRLVVEWTPEGVLLRAERLIAATAFEEARGCLSGKVKKSLNLDEIDAARRAAAKRRHDPG